MTSQNEVMQMAEDVKSLALFVRAEMYRHSLHDVRSFRTRGELNNAVIDYVTKIEERLRAVTEASKPEGDSRA